MLGYHHSPPFDHLVDLAKGSGLQVRLPVSEIVAYGRGKPGEEYRLLARVELWAPGGHTPLAWVSIREDDLERAALELLARAL
jgi:hypothetical protein